MVLIANLLERFILAGDNLKKKGVTLIELVAVIAIMSIISIAVFSILSNGLKIYSTTSAQSVIQDSARKVIDDISNNVNNAKVASLISVSSGKVVVDGNTFNNLGSSYGLVYVKLAASESNPFIYVVKNNAVYKVFLNGTGWNSPIGTYIDSGTAVDSPFSSNSNAFRLRLKLKYRNTSKSYTTFMSIGGV